MERETVEMEVKEGVLLANCTCGVMHTINHNRVRGGIFSCECGQLAYIPMKLINQIQRDLFLIYLSQKSPPLSKRVDGEQPRVVRYGIER